ncbi:formylglycine-generating enzyme family protein [Altererythrobacter sp. ZODW24]|uniref:formylglycine-generating enzyme family protein n=1 Tax=Altererythrobacter sp. ZODW24 TaxID=2185142 RepID=UPI000DF7B5D4|nr:formylglycine-generating enzyme family protein [Altererythrobacter sp. ZODW24]
MKQILFFITVMSLAGCAADEQSCRTPSDVPVAIAGGSFEMGKGAIYPEEGPPRKVAVAAFDIDPSEVTNRQFAAFVADTNHVTVAEKPAPETGKPGSAVFTIPTPGNPSWWRWKDGASWRHPDGPGSSITDKLDYPVVQVAYEDAAAYAKWAGRALPSAEQWEYAAQGGGAHQPASNSWQGVFPAYDSAEDGYAGLAPVGCFEPNGFGLFDMTGNVWELTSSITEGGHVIKGGSYLCADNYCRRARPAAWQAQELGLGTSHVGFRTVSTPQGSQ